MHSPQQQREEQASIIGRQAASLRWQHQNPGRYRNKIIKAFQIKMSHFIRDSPLRAFGKHSPFLRNMMTTILLYHENMFVWKQKTYSGLI